MQFAPLRVSCPSSVRCLASSGMGGRPSLFPPVPGSGSCAPLWAGLCVRSGLAPGGGGAICVPPSLGGLVGGPRGAGDRGLLCLGQSLCLP